MQEGDREEVTISVYVKPLGKHASQAAIPSYVNTNCLSWLLAYAADELFFQGVVRAIIFFLEGKERKFRGVRA